MRRPFHDFVLFPLLAASLFWASTSHGEPPARDHDITIDDYFTQADLFEVAFSPDGKHIAYSEGRWQASTDDRKSDIWVVNIATGKSTRLTFDRGSDHDLKWSPDSKFIYSVAVRKREGEKRPPYDGKAQVWRIAADGGESVPVTRVEGGIGSFQLASDGHTLYYTAEYEAIDESWKGLRQQFKDIQYGHGINQLSQVWKLDLQSWRTEKVIDDHRVIREMSLSPDGRRMAMITTPDDKVVSFEGQSRVDVFDFASKKLATMPNKRFRGDAPSPYGWLEKLAWSADNHALVFSIIFDGYPAEIMVAEWRSEEPVVFPLRRPEGVSIHSYGTPIQWRGQSRDLCFLGEEKARTRLYCATDVRDGKQGPMSIWTPGDVVAGPFHLHAGGERSAVIMNDPTSLRDIYLAANGQKLKRLTYVNPQADQWKLPKLSIFAWKGAKGDSVEGVLELPPDYQSGQRIPLVVEIHGGPTAATPFGLEYWIYGRTLLPSKGYAVLSPNYRGSVGYGDKFLTDLIGHENDIEVEDILKGVDALIDRGIADPDRLGVMGWSNGGYLTNCIISKTTRFKAASSGAGIVDTVMEWGANDEPAYAMVFKQGFPWNKAENYHRTSSTYQLDKIRTPTLIHVGGNDERCPPSQSRMLYRALKEYVKVPTELLVYPGEPHGLMKYKNRKAKMEWDLAWFEKYIRGK